MPIFAGLFETKKSEYPLPVRETAGRMIDRAGKERYCSGMSILFFDIDNTLLSHRTDSIPSGAENALKRARENGHLLFICSGRSVLGASRYYDQKLFDGLIAGSGSSVLYHNETVISRVIPDDMVRTALSLAEEYDFGYYLQCLNQNLVNTYGFERLGHFFHRDEEGLKEMGFSRIRNFPAGEVLKIDTFYRENAPVTEIRSRFPKELDDCSHLDPARMDFGSELTLHGVSKGNAIRELIRILDRDPEDTYGFGDSENDISMFQACGVGIAMGNADPETKEAADYITTDIEEDGIRNAMAHFGLI